jgi:hypothetical protein
MRILRKIHAIIASLLRLNSVYVILVADEGDHFNQVLLTYDLCHALETLNEFNHEHTRISSGKDKRYKAMLLKLRVSLGKI